MPWSTFCRAAIAVAWLFALGVCLMGAPAHARGWPTWRAEPSIRTTSPILAEAARWLGRGNMTGTVGPWCADAVSFWLRRTGHRPLPGRLALDGLKAGPRVASPKPGDLAVMRRHITLFVARQGDSFLGLGGNQSHRVTVARFPLRAVVAFVEPR